MNTINRRKAQLSVVAVAALAIFTVAAVMLLAGGFATGTAQAQRGGDTGGTTPTPTPTPPQPCGPGKPDANFPDEPDEAVSSGHYALFDAYWLPDPGLADDTKTGTLNNNLCPPKAKHEDVTNAGVTTEKTTLSPSNIDLRTTIIEVDDTHKVDVVSTNAAAGTDKLSLAKYKEVRKGLGLGEGDPVPAGTQVYWLRLEDPALGTDPSSLVLGFSTGHLDKNYWDNPNGPTFQYEMESVRVLGANPADLPHVLTYWEPEMRKNDGTAKVVWDGANTDVNAMPLEAGKYEHLEWVFTKPGTYVLSIHLKGHVRQTKPTDFAGTWERATPDDTVTSVPHRYVFHVGDLHINDQPHFGAVRSVTAGTRANHPVGDAIALYGTDADTLELNLDGVGSGDFKVTEEASIWGRGARILVAEGANLSYPGADPENPEQAYYDLHLKVSDKHDYENDSDEEIDSIIPLRIHVQPQEVTSSPSHPTLISPWVSALISDEHPRAGEEISITVQAHGLDLGWITRDITLFEGVGDQKRQLEKVTTYANDHHTFKVERAEAGTQRYSVVYVLNNEHTNPPPRKLSSGWYPVIWRK